MTIPNDPFYQAVTAIDAGDTERLQNLLDAHPSLATDRLEGSPEWLRSQVGDAADGFFSRPYLLWFVAEDPVRNGRLPSNIADVIRVIAAAARSSNAASLQDQLDSTLRLVCWSGVAADAQLQLPMIDALIDEGRVGPRDDEYFDRFERTAAGFGVGRYCARVGGHYVEESDARRRPQYAEIVSYLREVQGLSPLDETS